MHCPKHLTILGILALGMPHSATADLVVNGGFETGDLSGWTLAGNDVPLQQNTLYGVEGTDPFNAIAPQSGNFQFFSVDLVKNEVTLSQNLSTTINQNYILSFYVAQDTAPVSTFTNDFSASWAGTALLTLAGISPTGGYKEYTYAVMATTTSTPIVFTMGNDLGEFLFDSVSVVPAATVPEPATLTLTLLGGVCLAAVRWTRRSRRAESRRVSRC